MVHGDSRRAPLFGKSLEELGRALPGNGNPSESSPGLAKVPKVWEWFGFGMGTGRMEPLFSIPNLREFPGLWEHWSSLGSWEVGANVVLESPSLEVFRKCWDMALESLENTWGWDGAAMDLRDLSQP